MEYRTYGGLTLVLEEEALVVRRRSGRQTADHGAVARRVPFRDISDAVLQPATQMRTGLLVLGLHGQPAIADGSAAHFDNPDAFEFTYRYQNAFAGLHDWLQHVVRVNAALPPPTPPAQRATQSAFRVTRQQLSPAASSERILPRGNRILNTQHQGIGMSLTINSREFILTPRGPAQAVRGFQKKRRIPLSSITGVDFLRPTRIRNGVLTFGLDGHSAKSPQTTSVFDPNVIMFTYGHRQSYADLYWWLMDIIEINTRQVDRTPIVTIEAGLDPNADPPTSFAELRVAGRELGEWTPTSPPTPAELGSDAPDLVQLRWVPPANWPIPVSYDPPPMVWLPDPDWSRDGAYPSWRVLGQAPAVQLYTSAEEPAATRPGGGGSSLHHVDTRASRLSAVNALERMTRWCVEQEAVLLGRDTVWAETYGRVLPANHPTLVRRARLVQQLATSASAARDELIAAIRLDQPPGLGYRPTVAEVSQMQAALVAASDAVHDAFRFDTHNALYSSAADHGPTGAGDWMEAERLAAAAVRQFGFADARITPPGADEGLDVVSRRAAAQVKYTGSPVGRPTLQQLEGAAGGRATIFFSRSGYARTAVHFADQVGMALFTISLPASVTAVNHSALRLVERSSG